MMRHYHEMMTNFILAPNTINYFKSKLLNSLKEFLD
jgi:hypothetical protein